MAVVSLSFTVDGQNTKIVIDSDGSVVSLASAIEKARSESDRFLTQLINQQKEQTKVEHAAAAPKRKNPSDDVNVEEDSSAAEDD
jgi:hypothetical protein